MKFRILAALCIAISAPMHCMDTDTPPNPFTLLPEELIPYIMARGEFAALAAMQLVCKQFKRLASIQNIGLLIKKAHSPEWNTHCARHILENICTKGIAYPNLLPNAHTDQPITENDKLILSKYIKFLTKYIPIDSLLGKVKIKCSLVRYASQYGQVEVVEALIKNGAPLNHPDDPVPPLYVACEKGKLSVVQYLLTHDSNSIKATSNGWSPLDVACENSHTEIVQHLIKYRANINTPAPDGSTPLYAACANGHAKILEVLLNTKPDLNNHFFRGYSPLYIACHNGHTEIVQHLIKYGANVNTSASNGRTPLHDPYGSTPLHIACKKGHSKIIQLLLDAGADRDARDNLNRTPEDIAQINGLAHLFDNKKS